MTTLPNISFIKQKLYGEEVIIMPSNTDISNAKDMYLAVSKLKDKQYLIESAIYTKQLFGINYPHYNIKPKQSGWWMICSWDVIDSLMLDDYSRRRDFWIEIDPDL